MYANNPIFAVLYLSFNFEMSPCGPSNKKSSLKRDRDVLGGGAGLERGGKLVEGARPSGEEEVHPRAVGPSSEGWCGYLMGCRGRWVAAGRGLCSCFSCG
jgi:hypothetical protein